MVNLDVLIYNEQPFVDVGQTIQMWFGNVSNDNVIDVCIMFSYLFLFVFALSIFSLLFRRK